MKKIDVFYNGWGESWKLAVVAESGTKILFEYTSEALQKGLELSPLHLKLQKEAYSNFPNFQFRLPGLIADCLPDGWGLYLMDKIFRKQGLLTEAISPLDRLCFLGNRTMGALSFEPSLDQKLEFKDLTVLKIAQEVHKLVSDHASKALPQLALLGGSPHGARPKVAVNYDPISKIISTKNIRNGNPWIFKFPAAGEHKEVCAIELLYTQLARKVGIEVFETEYLDLSKTLSAFGMKRFDRKNHNRVPTHTVAGALHANYRIPSSVDYLSFLRLTRLMTKDEREVQKAFLQCVFNVVFNNRDDHPKNFSFLMNEQKCWKLTPAYDLTFSRGPGGEHQMDICGEGKNPDLSHLLELARGGGINKNFLQESIDRTLIVAENFLKESKGLPIRKTSLNTMDGVIRANVKKLIRPR